MRKEEIKGKVMMTLTQGKKNTRCDIHSLSLTQSSLSDDEESDKDSDDDDDDDEDDEAALQAELERIREERALAKARKEQEEREFQEKLAQEQALRSNPLLNLDSSSTGKVRKHSLILSFFIYIRSLY